MTTTKEESRTSIPPAFGKELVNIFTKDVLIKYQEAMDGPVSEVEEKLPKDLDDSVMKAFLSYIDTQEQELIVEKYKAEITSMEAELEVRKGEKVAKKSKSQPKPKRNKSKSRAKKDDKADSTEEGFKAIMENLKKETASTKLKKDDYQTYSKV